jgi:hypothetical protein
VPRVLVLQVQAAAEKADVYTLVMLVTLIHNMALALLVLLIPVVVAAVVLLAS